MKINECKKTSPQCGENELISFSYLLEIICLPRTHKVKTSAMRYAYRGHISLDWLCCSRLSLASYAVIREWIMKSSYRWFFLIRAWNFKYRSGDLLSFNGKWFFFLLYNSAWCTLGVLCRLGTYISPWNSFVKNIKINEFRYKIISRFHHIL